MGNGRLVSVFGSMRGGRAIHACCVVASLASTAACAAMDGGGGGVGGGGGRGGGGGGGGGGWKAMPLVDDLSNPDVHVYHKGNDLVSGIYYESPEVGYIVSQGADETFHFGGAVFKASGSAVTEVAFSGDGTGIRLLGPIDFIGLEPTSTGYIAMAYAADVIASKDGGKTFKIERNGPPDFGIEPVLAFQVSATGTTLVRKTGAVSVAAAAPAPETTYDDVWAPQAAPPVPDPVPAEMCQAGPRGTGVPTTRYGAYVSPDRSFLAYVSNPDFEVEICISSDGGRTFHPHKLDVPTALADYTPSGVVFTSAMTGVTWAAQPSAGAYVKRTIDGGMTWRDATLPAGIATGELELPAGFFAPDGLNGWIAGYDHKAQRALVLATADGGATWATVDGVADAVAAVGGDKLYSGFALDAAHVWLGGAHGVVLHN